VAFCVIIHRGAGADTMPTGQYVARDEEWYRDLYDDFDATSKTRRANALKMLTSLLSDRNALVELDEATAALDVQETKKVGHGTWGVLCRRLCKAIDRETDDLKSGGSGQRVLKDEWVDSLKELLEQSQRRSRTRHLRHNLTAVASKLFDHCGDMLALSTSGVLSERAVAQYEKIVEKDLLAVGEYSQCARSKTVEGLLTSYIIPILSTSKGVEGMSNSAANRRTRMLASVLALVHSDLSPGAKSVTWEFFLAGMRKIRYDNQQAVNMLVALREFVDAHGKDLLSHLPEMVEVLLDAIRRALGSTCGNNAKLAFKCESARLLTTLIGANADCWLTIGDAIFDVMDTLDPAPEVQEAGYHGIIVSDTFDPEVGDSTAEAAAIRKLGADAIAASIATRDSVHSKKTRTRVNDSMWAEEVLRRAAENFSTWGGMFQTALATDMGATQFSECTQWLQRKLVDTFQGNDGIDYGNLSILRCVSELSLSFSRLHEPHGDEAPELQSGWKDIGHTLIEWMGKRMANAPTASNVAQQQHTRQQQAFSNCAMRVICDVIERCTTVKFEIPERFSKSSSWPASPDACGEDVCLSAHLRLYSTILANVHENCSVSERRSKRERMIRWLEHDSTWACTEVEVWRFVRSAMFGRGWYAVDDVRPGETGGGDRGFPAEVNYVGLEMGLELTGTAKDSMWKTARRRSKDPDVLLRIAYVASMTRGELVRAYRTRHNEMSEADIGRAQSMTDLVRVSLRKVAKHLELSILQASGRVKSGGDLASFERRLTSIHRSLDGLLHSMSPAVSSTCNTACVRAEDAGDVQSVLDDFASALRRLPASMTNHFACVAERWDTEEDCDSMPTMSPSPQVNLWEMRDRITDWLTRMATSMSSAGFSRQASVLEQELLVAVAQSSSNPWDTRARVVHAVAGNLSNSGTNFDSLVATLQMMMCATAKAEREKWVFFSAQCEHVASTVDCERDVGRREHFVREMFLKRGNLLESLETKTCAHSDGREYVSSSSPKCREASIRLNVQLIVTVLNTDAWPDTEEVLRICDYLHLDVRMLELLESLRDSNGGVRTCAAENVPRLYQLFMRCSTKVQMHPIKFFDAACEKLCVRYSQDQTDDDDREMPFEERVTDIAFLEESAIRCGITESGSLKMLCGHAVLVAEDEEAVCNALDRVGRALGYEDGRRSLLLFHSAVITAFLALERFRAESIAEMHHIFGFSSKSDFLHCWSAPLIASFASRGISCNVGRLARDRGTHEGELLEEASSLIITECTVASIPWDQIKKTLSKFGTPDAFKTSLARVIEQLAHRTRLKGSMGSDKDTFIPMKVSVDKMKKVQHAAAAGHDRRGGELSHAAVSTLLSHQRAFVQSLRSVRHKCAYHGFYAVIEWLGPTASKPMHLRTILLTLADMICDGCLDACTKMEELLRNFDRRADASHALLMDDTFGYLASRLWTLVSGHDVTSPTPAEFDGDSNAALTSVYRYLSERDCMRDRLPFLVPVQGKSAPPAMVIKEALETTTRHLNKMPEELRLRFAPTLDAQYELLASCNATATSGDINRIAWHLIHACVRDENATLANIAGRELGYSGEVYPRTAAFSNPSTDSGVDAASASKEFSVVSEEALMQIMAIVSESLYDESSVVVAAAQATAFRLSELRHVKKVMVKNADAVAYSRLPSDNYVYFLKSYFDGKSGAQFTLHTSEQRHFIHEGQHRQDIEQWWAAATTLPYDDWIKTVVGHLILEARDGLIIGCRPLAIFKVEVAEKLFPLVLLDIALRGDHVHLASLSDVLAAYLANDQSSDMRCIDAIVGALEFLRRYNHMQASRARGRGGETRQWRHSYWFRIHYLTVATAAYRCGKCFTSLMFVEEYSREHEQEREPPSTQPGSYESTIDDDMDERGRLLLGIYQMINEPDSIYCLANIHHERAQLALAEHEGRWLDAIEICDVRLRADCAEGARGDDGQAIAHYLRCMKSMGNLNAVLKFELDESEILGATESRAIQDIRDECVWRLGEWSNFQKDPVKTLRASGRHKSCRSSTALSVECSSTHFNSFVVASLQSIETRNRTLFEGSIAAARQETVTALGVMNGEGTHVVNAAVVKLQMLNEISDSWDVVWAGRGETVETIGPRRLSSYIHSIKSSKSPREARDVLRGRLAQFDGRFDLFEPFIAVTTRLVLATGDSRLSALHLFAVASVARKSARQMDAMAAIRISKSVDWSSPSIPGAWKLEATMEEAKLLWAAGDTRRQAAMSLAQRARSQMDGADDQSPLRINTLSLVGKWLGQSCKEHSKAILRDYLVTAAMEADSLGDTLLRYRAHFRLACYADEVHCQIRQRLASPEYIRRHRRLAGEVLAPDRSDGMAVKRRKLLTEKVKKDSDELENQCREMSRVAVTAYSTCLSLGSRHDLRSTMRMCSLWFSDMANELMNREIGRAVETLPSYKFVPLIHQLSSRISSDRSAFQNNLRGLIVRLLRDHPHHTLTHIYALMNQSADETAPFQRQKTMEARVIWQEYANGPGSLAGDTETLIGYYDSINSVLRMKDKDKGVAKGKTCTDNTRLPRHLLNVGPLPKVHLFTVPLDVQESCAYDEHVIGFQEFEKSFEWMDGINSTKMITTIGTDGHTYAQIGKYQSANGVDDLRQDAVMQQLFGLVNTFFDLRAECRRRRLRMRTYRVVPFSPRSGLLQFVDSCKPFGNFAKEAHERHRRCDWSPDTCRRLMAEANKVNMDIHKAKVRVASGLKPDKNNTHLKKERDVLSQFKSICENFKPAFHNFFLEMFPSPPLWFESRLTYTRSVAASSMITYLVGLGDRHAGNILVDSSSAEVIHIDHGIAFEQGKLLDVPETVPFRLTRDMVDGMGFAGKEGVFRQCCELTMDVLRAHKDELLTIMDVLLHDPLHSWTFTKRKAAARQRDLDEVSLLTPREQGDEDDLCDANSSETFEASTVLQRIREKLDGIEMGEVLDVKSQVQRLLQEATDAENLASLFHGWQAWL